MNFKLKIWRQANPKSKGEFGTYEARNISPNTSFLEMLDIVNDELTERGEAPIAFDSDCREGICGTCALTINGQAHGPKHPAAACQLYMRSFDDGKTIMVEPFRAKPFPLVRDLVIDRSALDRIVQAGGFIAARAGSAPEANSIANTQCRVCDEAPGSKNNRGSKFLQVAHAPRVLVSAARRNRLFLTI